MEYESSTCQRSPVVSLQAIFSNTLPSPLADSYKGGAANNFTFAFRRGLCILYFTLLNTTNLKDEYYISIGMSQYLGDDKQLVSSDFAGRYPFV